MAGRRQQFGYQLHESTRRALCRLAFVLLGLAPLLFCLSLCVAEFLPSHHRWRAARWENWLSSQLGITVDVSSVENLSPDRYALHGVRLIHPETNATLGRAIKVDIVSTQGKWHVRLEGTELESRDLAAAWKMTHDWILCRPALHSKPVVLNMDKLTIHGLTQETMLTNITMQSSPQAESLQLDVNFHLAQASDGQRSRTLAAAMEQTPSRVTIRRNHQASRLSTVIELDTATPLPCSALSSLIPAIDRLGGATTFTGYLQLELLADSWTSSLSKAEFQHIDFAQLTRNTHANITGMGTIRVDEAQLKKQRIEYAHVTANVELGRINNEFLQAMGRYLDVDIREAGSETVADQAFDRANASMWIHPQGLALVGEIRDQSGSLAARPENKWNMENILALERIVDVLNPSTSTARSAFAWLPIESPATQTASRDSLSRTH